MLAIPQTRIEYLLQQYAINNCTKKELIEFFDWINLQNNDTALQNALQTVWENENAADVIPIIDREKLYARIIIQASSGLKLYNWGRGWVRLTSVLGLQHYLHQQRSPMATLVLRWHKGLIECNFFYTISNKFCW